MLINKVDNIMNVYYIEKAKIYKKKLSEDFNSFIVIEDKDGGKLVYNITTGKDLSFEKNLRIAIFENKTKFLTFYEYDKSDFNTTLEIGKLNNIKMYKMGILRNTYSNVNICCSDFLVFEYDEKKIIIDYVNNHLYINDNVSIECKEKDIVTIFNNGIKGGSIYKMLMKRAKYLKFLFTFFDVELQ